MNMRAGIDPNGGAAWSDADVVWGGAGSPHDAWQAFSVEATATGNQITVFTYADWGVTGVNQCRQFLDTWYDDAQLVAQTPPTATPAPIVPTATLPARPTGGVPTEPAAATAAATLATTTAPTTTPATTATPTGNATICVNAFLDANGNGLRDADEGYVAGVTLTVAQGTTVVGQAVSPGQDTPVCFGNLLAGRYEVAQTLPPSLEATTQANATVDVVEGQTIALEFGSRLRTTPTAAPPTPTPDAAQQTATAAAGVTTPEEGRSGGWLVYLGLGAIVVGVALLGALLYMVLRR
jgi:hypothetical protein